MIDKTYSLRINAITHVFPFSSLEHVCSKCGYLLITTTLRRVSTCANVVARPVFAKLLSGA